MLSAKTYNSNFRWVGLRYKLFLLLTLMALQTLDVLTTYYGLYFLDHSELNPFFNLLIEALGFWNASFLKLSLVLVCGTLALRFSSWAVLVAVVITFLIVVLNMTGIFYTLYSR